MINMRNLIFLLIAACAVISSPAHADITKDLIGTWNVTVVTQFDGKKEVGKSQEKISKLKNGTLRQISYEKINGKSRKTSDTWYYPTGELYQVSFDRKGILESEAEGTWQVRGARLHMDVTISTLEGDLNTVGSLRRLNRKKWTGFFTAAGLVKVSVTMTRVGK